MTRAVERSVGVVLTVAVAVEIGLGIAMGLLFGW